MTGALGLGTLRTQAEQELMHVNVIGRRPLQNLSMLIAGFKSRKTHEWLEIDEKCQRGWTID